MERWTRQELASLLIQLWHDETSSVQLGPWLLANWWRLPPYPGDHWDDGITPKTASSLTAIQVPLDALYGTSWLFEPAERWPRDEDHWQRVANLFDKPEAQPRSGWLAREPITVCKLPNERFWLEDGCRRVYAMWIFGATSVPAFVMGTLA